MTTRAELAIKELTALKAIKAPYNQIYEEIAKYMFQRKQGFLSTVTPGDFYTAQDVWDNHAGLALQNMVSSIDGALWKNEGRTFKVTAPRQAGNSTEIKEFYKEINNRVVENIEHEESAFGTARVEALREKCAFGVGAIGCFSAPWGSKHKIEYRALSLKNLYLVEDARGRVVKEFYVEKLNAFQLEEEFGAENLPQRVIDRLNNYDYDTKYEVLWVIRPRKMKKGAGWRGYNYESLHILIDDKLILREHGYYSNPIIVSRFYKNEGEPYGRSAAFSALSPTIELNALVEMISKGTELAILPPWYVLDDGAFGNGMIDRSPNSIVPVDVTSSRITGMSPIGPISSVGDMNPAMKLMEVLIEEINGHFLADKLTDLNNTSRMTLGEAQIRNELRSDLIGSVFSRDINENLRPLARRSIVVLDSQNVLGVVPGSNEHLQVLAAGRIPLLIPDELVKLKNSGIEIYNIEFISPAARILRSEENRGLMSLWQFAGAFGAIAPELIVRLNKTKGMELARELGGGPEDALLSDDEFATAWDAYQQQQAQQAQLMMAKEGAEISKTAASANQQNAQAEAMRGGMNGSLNGGGQNISPGMMV